MAPSTTSSAVSSGTSSLTAARLPGQHRPPQQQRACHSGLPEGIRFWLLTPDWITVARTILSPRFTTVIRRFHGYPSSARRVPRAPSGTSKWFRPPLPFGLHGTKIFGGSHSLE